ncbi:hypothetical protein DRN50_07345 [Thermococci archaeon]|nr:MAG: hypothetical protein DRN50_07345 [Thermococci archaeon]
MRGIGAVFIKSKVAVVGYIEQGFPVSSLVIVRGDLFVGRGIDELTVKDVSGWYDEKFKKFCDSEHVNYQKLPPEDRYILKKKFWDQFPQRTVDVRCPTLFAKTDPYF